MSKVSFDFDNTLTVMRFNPDEGIFCDFHGPNLVMIQCMHAYVEMGREVFVVTSRNESVKSKTEIMRLLTNNGLIKKVAGLRFTNGAPKADTISSLGITRHYDDDPDEIAALPESCEGILVKNGCVDAEGVVCDPLEPRFLFPEE
jgi:hypothetical protein